MPGIFIYQILTQHTKREDLDPGFLVLDNSKNERPDWFEYWPIRNFLIGQALEEESFYGFLSPKFKQKTNLSATAARDFVGEDNGRADVVLLSPSLQLTAYHLNLFIFGDKVHPGLLKIADQFFRHIGEPTNLHTLITNSRNEVFSNYVIGKPRFWRAWLKVTEQLFAVAESLDEPLGAELRKPTQYRGRNDVQMKVFIMERVATWILARDSSLVPRVRDPFVARSRIYKLPGAIVCDALKIAHMTNCRAEYLELFFVISRFGRSISWLVRMGNLLGIRPIKTCISTLSSYWTKTGEL